MTWLGRTFRAINPYIESGVPHLHFVITDGEEEEDELVLVAMTSSTTKCPAHCTLNPSDADCQDLSEFLKMRSTVVYQDAMVCTIETLCAAINNGSFQAGPRTGDALIQRIQDGALLARNLVPRKALKLVEEAVSARSTG